MKRKKNSYSAQLEQRLRKNQSLNVRPANDKIKPVSNPGGYARVLNGLYLDDRRYAGEVERESYPPNVRWTLVRNFFDFMDAIEKQKFDIVSFDYDLGPGDINGRTCLERFVDHCRKSKHWPEKVVMHSGDDHIAGRMKIWYDDQKIRFEDETE